MNDNFVFNVSPSYCLLEHNFDPKVRFDSKSFRHFLARFIYLGVNQPKFVCSKKRSIDGHAVIVGIVVHKKNVSVADKEIKLFLNKNDGLLDTSWEKLVVWLHAWQYVMLENYVSLIKAELDNILLCYSVDESNVRRAKFLHKIEYKVFEAEVCVVDSKILPTVNITLDKRRKLTLLFVGIPIKTIKICDSNIAEFRDALISFGFIIKNGFGSSEGNVFDWLSVAAPNVTESVLLEPNQNPAEAVGLMWDMSGLDKFHKFEQAAAQNNGKGLDSMDAADIIHWTKVFKDVSTSKATQATCMQAFEEEMDHFQPIMCCACCGCRRMESMKYTKMDDLKMLQITDKTELKSYLEIPDMYKAVHNVFQFRDHFYRVHERFLRHVPLAATPAGRWPSHQFPIPVPSINSILDEAWSKITAPICDTCEHFLVKSVKPPYSLISGYDFGNMEYVYTRFDVYGLTPPTELEMQVLAKYRMYCEVIKLVSQHSAQESKQSRLVGHVVVLPSDGFTNSFDGLSPSLPVLNVDDHVKVFFVGTREQWTLKKELLMNKTYLTPHFTISRANTLNWLTFIKSVNPEYADIVCNLKFDDKQFEDFRSNFINSAQIIENDTLINLEQYTSGDVGEHNADAFINSLEESAHSVNKQSSDFCLPAVCVIPNPLSSRDNPVEITKAVLNSLSLNITRENNNIIKEFGNNDKLFYGTFPFIFILGKGMKGTGSCPLLFRQMILRQYDNRGAKNSKFNFIMFNQAQRHAAISSIAARVHNNPKSVLKFQSIVSAPGYIDRLKEAVKSPDSAETKKLVKDLLPMIKVSGKNVPFGASERAQTLSLLNSYTSFFGLPTWFITISPADIDSPLMIRLGHCHKDNSNVFGSNVKSISDLGVPVLEIPIPENSSLRAIALAQNPGVAAEVFEKIIRAVVKYLLNLPMTDDYKRTKCSYDVIDGGVMGLLKALVMIFECQGRGSLHGHAAGWGSLVPKVLELVADSKVFADIVADAVNSMVLAQLPPCVHAYTKQEQIYPKRPGLSMIAPTHVYNENTLSFECVPPYERHAHYELVNELESKQGIISSFLPDSLDVMTDVDRRAFLSALKVNVHKCGFSCAKGKSGQRGCRFGFPNPSPITKTGPCILSLETGDASCKEPVNVQVSYEISPLKCHLPCFTELNAAKDTFYQFTKLLFKTDDRNLLWQLERPNLKSCEGESELSQEAILGNSHVTPYNYAVSACLTCNQAMIFLGNAEQCKSIIFYMIKYMVKDSTMLQNAAVLLIDAFKHIHKFRSVAENTGTPIRDAQHMITRVVNSISGKIEVSDSLACASNFGLKSSIISHNTWLVFIIPAISYLKNYIKMLCVDDTTFMEESDSDSSDSDSANIDLDNDVLFGKNQTNDDDCNYPSNISRHLKDDMRVNWNRSVALEEENHSNERDGTTTVHKINKSDKLVLVSQHQSYSLRGPALANMNFLEWSTLVVINDFKPTKERSVDNTRGAGRRPNNSFRFDKHHPLESVRVQSLRSKLLVPELCGSIPPNFPSEKNGDKWDKSAASYAEYCITLMVPWRVVMLNNIERFEISAQIMGNHSNAIRNSLFIPLLRTHLSFDSFCRWVSWENPPFIHRCRVRYIVNFSTLFKLNMEKRFIFQKYRHSNARKWGSKSKTEMLLSSTDRDEADPLDPVARMTPSQVMEIKTLLSQLDDVCNMSDEDRKYREMLSAVSNITDQIFHEGIIVGGYLLNNMNFSDDFSTTASITFDHVQATKLALKANNVKYRRHETIFPEVDQPDGDYGGDLFTPYYWPNATTKIDNSNEPGLNAKQNEALLFVVAQIQKQIDSNYSNNTSVVEQLLIHGGPGTGKSFVANAIYKRLNKFQHNVLLCAPTGVAATLLDCGRTLHGLLELPFDKNDIFIELGATTLAGLITRFENVVAIIVDEVSFLSATYISFIDVRLRKIKASDLPFGGLMVILMGDMFQLPPVQGLSLYKSALLFSPDAKIKLTGLANHECLGTALFQQYKKIELVNQQRLQCDTEEELAHVHNIELLRKSEDFPITKEFISSMKIFSPVDLLNDQKWFTAPIAVNGNEQRMAFNVSQACRFGRVKNHKLIRWKKRLVTKDMSADWFDDFYESNLDLYDYFICGAPAYLTWNLDPQLRLANGTSCVMHSLVFENDQIREIVAREINNAAPGDIVTLDGDKIPVAINCDFDSRTITADNWPANCSLLTDKVLVPIFFGNATMKKKLPGKLGQFIHFNGFPVELGFSVTYHKLEGKTLDHVILDLNPYPAKRCPLTFHAFYVGVTRVRCLENLRILPPSSFNALEYLSANTTFNKINPSLKIWLSGFNECGKWTMPLLVATAIQKHARKGSNVPLTSAALVKLVQGNNKTSLATYCGKPKPVLKVSVDHSGDDLGTVINNNSVGDISVSINDINNRGLTGSYDYDSDIDKSMPLPLLILNKCLNRQPGYRLKTVDDAVGSLTGNCFFQAVITTLKLSGEISTFESKLATKSKKRADIVLRKLAVDFLKENRDRTFSDVSRLTYADLVESAQLGHKSLGITYHEYLGKMQNCNVWADSPVIYATAEVLQAKLKIFCLSVNALEPNIQIVSPKSTVGNFEASEIVICQFSQCHFVGTVRYYLKSQTNENDLEKIKQDSAFDEVYWS